MIRKPLLFAVMAIGFNVWAQQNDPVVMRVAGKDVTRSEFEYSYNKNNSEHTLDKKSLDEYVQLFINFKLKVAEAEALQFDTLTSFKEEFKGYRSQQAQEYLIDTSFIESEARRVYKVTADNIGEEGLVLTQHILLMIPQNADEATQQKTMARMDSIYQALQNGASMTELAEKYSEDPGSGRQGGKLPWFHRKQIFAEFADVAYSLQINEISKPFLSPAGVHIVKLLGKKPFEPYEFHRKSIHAFLEQRGIRQYAMNVKADSLYKQYGGKVAREKVLAYEDSLLESKYPEFKYLMQEYHDGLLLFEVSNQNVWDKAAKDEEGLKNYFKKNKKKYTWDTPRFKGGIVHATSAELLKQVQKKLKKLPESQWKNYVQKEVNQDSLKLVFVEKGLFKVGDNRNVDHYAFKQGEPQPKEGYPFTGIVGKVQKKRPESYVDVRGPLTSDYQNELEKQWIQELRGKYAVEIYHDVLQTVNNH